MIKIIKYLIFFIVITATYLTHETPTRAETFINCFGSDNPVIIKHVKFVDGMYGIEFTITGMDTTYALGWDYDVRVQTPVSATPYEIIKLQPDGSGNYTGRDYW